MLNPIVPGALTNAWSRPGEGVPGNPAGLSGFYLGVRQSGHTEPVPARPAIGSCFWPLLIH